MLLFCKSESNMGRDNFRGRGGFRGGFRGRERGGHRKNHFEKNRNNFNKKDFTKNKFQSVNQDSPKDWLTKERTHEDKVGINCYLTESNGFTGLFKLRFSDFHVNEIDKEGNVVVLDNLDVPEPPQSTKDLSDDQKKQICEEFKITEEMLKKVQKIIDADKSEESVEVDVTGFEKEKRSTLHNFIKSSFGAKVNATTFDKDDKKFIKITKCDSKSRQERGRQWLYKSEYTHFVLHKENQDTIHATSLLASQIRTNPSRFVYAGTKDRRAKTSQWICVRKLEPLSFSKSVKRLSNSGIHVGNFVIRDYPLVLGDCKGNLFKIALKQINKDKEIIETSLNSLRDRGFINYFGLQRFGNCADVPTFMVGIQLLKNNYKGACELILKQRDGEPGPMKQMRDVWFETKDANKALAELSGSQDSRIETRILRGLQKNSNDFCGALGNVPRNMRMLYTHSYQSYIWNQVVSKRVQKFGLDLVEGDLVFVDKTIDDDVASLTAAENVDCDTSETQQKETEAINYKALVRPLTKSEIESGQYSIYDLVYPLPGHDITYPSNEVAEYYKEFMEKDGINISDLKNKQKIDSLPGAYRKVIIKPEDIQWRFIRHNNLEDSLILSDIEKLQGKAEFKDIPDGSLTALVLEFRLPSSAYATMLLRELMKVDTSVDAQLNLAEEIKEPNEATEEVPKLSDNDSQGNKHVLEADDEPEIPNKKIKVD